MVVAVTSVTAFFYALILGDRWIATGFFPFAVAKRLVSWVQIEFQKHASLACVQTVLLA